MEPYKAGRAFVAGVVGGAMMSLGAWAARDLRAIPIELEMALGTLTGLSPGRGTFAIGLVMHLTICGLCAHLYAIVFEHLAHRAGALTGAIASIVHAMIAGLVIGALPAIHPQMPEVLASPGPFLSHFGDLAVAMFVIAHALFGAIVGTIYGRVLHPGDASLALPALDRRTA